MAEAESGLDATTSLAMPPESAGEHPIPATTGPWIVSPVQCKRFFRELSDARYSERAGLLSLGQDDAFQISQEDVEKLCSNFSFELRSDVPARVDADHLVVRKRTDSQAKGAYFDACKLADLIRNTEALPSSDFLELRFEDIDVKGRLTLTGVDTTARLVFDRVAFVAPAAHDPCAEESHDTELADASVVVDHSRLRERIIFHNTEFEGDVIFRTSVFEHSVEFGTSSFNGDLVFEDVDFRESLKLGQTNTLHGQLVFHAARIDGNLEIDGPNFQDTHLGPLLNAIAEQDKPLTTACVCKDYGATPAPRIRIDINRIKNNEQESGKNTNYIRGVCRKLSNLPRCQRSNATNPALIEISAVEIGGGFAMGNVDLSKVRPSVDKRVESTMSRLGAPTISVQDLTVNGGTSFVNNRTAQIYINESQFQGLRTTDNRFDRFFLSFNTIGLFKSLRDEFRVYLNVSSNDVIQSVKFDSPRFTDELAASGGKTRYGIRLSDNYIGRDLTFTPFKVSAGQFDAFDLSANRIGGILSVDFPVESTAKDTTDKDAGYHLAWSGKVDLTNLDINGLLKLRLSTDRNKRFKRASVDSSYKLSVRSIDSSNLACSASRENPQGSDDKSALIHINLDNTKTNGLVWGPPFEESNGDQDGYKCFSWEGVGLRYANWHKARPSSTSRPEKVGSAAQLSDIRKWMGLYTASNQHGIPPDPLHQIADYLASSGKQSESLDMRAEAKAAAFPFRLSWNACRGSFGGDSRADEQSSWYSSCMVFLGNVASWFIFLPTDFGTDPARALIWLVVVTFLAGVSYAICRSRWRGAWSYLEGLRDAQQKRDHISESFIQRMANADLDRATMAQRSASDVPVHNADSDTSDKVRRFSQNSNVAEVLDLYAGMPQNSRYSYRSSDHYIVEKRTGRRLLPFGEIMNISAVPGFLQYDRNRRPQRFSIFRYSVDVSIPVIDLHAYSQYFPASGFMRLGTVLQHLIGWWVLSSFLATLAVF